jgi:hypothetical protein
MKHIERITLQDACPKCGSQLELEETTWDSMSGSLVSVLCCKCKVRGENSNNKAQAFERFEKKLALKEKREREKPEKILTDIRDYLVAILDEWHKRIDEPNFYEENIGVYNHIRKELDDLTEYAEKLGVEL